MWLTPGRLYATALRRRAIRAWVCSCVRCLGSYGQRATGRPPPLFAGRRFQPVAQRAVVAALQAPFLALALARFYQVLQTPRTLHRRLAALSATPVAFHSQL